MYNDHPNSYEAWQAIADKLGPAQQFVYETIAKLKTATYNDIYRVWMEKNPERAARVGFNVASRLKELMDAEAIEYIADSIDPVTNQANAVYRITGRYHKPRRAVPARTKDRRRIARLTRLTALYLAKVAVQRGKPLGVWSRKHLSTTTTPSKNRHKKIHRNHA